MPSWSTPDQRTTLVHGDCFEVAEQYAGQARLIITSPPYNVGKEYEHFETWDDYFDFIGRFGELCATVLEPGGYAVVVFQVEYTSPRRIEQVYHERFGAAGLRVITERVWAKRMGSCRARAYNSRSPRAMATHENVWTFRRSSERSWDPPRNRKRSWMSVWDTSDEPRGALKQHPAGYPEAIPRWAIEVHCDRGSDQLVMDPFMGVATSLSAARKYGVRSVGIERDRDYYHRGQDNLLTLLTEESGGADEC